MTVLGVDPGTRKIGFAVVDTAGGRAPSLGIIPVEALSERLREILVKTPVALPMTK